MGAAGEVSGDVQNAVAKPFGFAELVFAIEREQLRPDGDVVRGEGELEPRGVRLERVKRQVARTRRLQRLDAVLDLSVLAVKYLQLGDVLVGLVGDEALEAVTVKVGEGQLRCGVQGARADRSAWFPRAIRER